MSIKLFGVMFLMTCVILAPINNHFDWLPTLGNSTDPENPSTLFTYTDLARDDWMLDLNTLTTGSDLKDKKDTSFLWAYLVFTYVFTGLTIYFMRKQTLDVIRVRQDYLGSQSTI